MSDGPIKVCAACGEPKRVDLHTAEGWICRRCRDSASTVLVTYVIDSKRYHHLLRKQRTIFPERKAAVTSGGPRGGNVQ